MAGFNFPRREGPRYAGAWPGPQRASFASAPEGIRVVSFNIRFARDIEGALEALRSSDLADADVLLLQEMDLTGTERIACELQESFVYYPAALHPSSGRPLRPFGVSILSPWPIVEDHKIPLSPLSRSDGAGKTAAAALLRVKGRLVRVVNAHLQVGLTAEHLRTQMGEALAGAQAELAGQLPVIVAGDFNSRSRSLLAAVAEESNAHGLRAALRPGLRTVRFFPWQLDHILFSGLELMSAVRGPRRGSDHFPIRADLRFPDTGGASRERVSPESLLPWPPIQCGERID